MGTKRLITIKPVRQQVDRKGHKIDVYRGGYLDTNKYARLTPREKAARENLGNADYNPEDEKL